MTNDNSIFTLRFFGNEVSPQSFSIKELGNICIGFEDAINSIIDNSGQNASECSVSLVGILNNSNSLTIKANNEDTELAVNQYGKLVASKKYTDLPEPAYKFHQKVIAISKEKGCNLSLTSNEQELFVVSVDDEFIKQETVSIKFSTVIYGHLLGLTTSNIESDKTRAKIELFTGEKIGFDVSEVEREKLSPYLWHVVGLNGLATYNTLTKNYIKFKFDDIVPYKRGGIVDGIKSIKKITSGFWDTLNSNDEITNYLRD